MAIKINVDGYEVTVSDPVEAAALLRELKKKPEISDEEISQVHLSARSRMSGEGEVVDRGALQLALEFLRVLRDGAGPHGSLGAFEIMTVLKAASPKGIGSKSVGINKILDSLPIRRDWIYENPKTASGRVWRPGRQIDKAILELEARLDNS